MAANSPKTRSQAKAPKQSPSSSKTISPKQRRKTVSIGKRPTELDPRVEYITSFWVEVEDPLHGQTLYVNPVTGECRWELEPGTLCLPRTSSTWWQIEDEKNNGAVYYFNTQTKETTWTRPAQDQGIVIPLTALQESGASRRFSQAIESYQMSEVHELAGLDQPPGSANSSNGIAASETTVSPPQSPASTATTVPRVSMSSPPTSMPSTPHRRLPKSSSAASIDSFTTARASEDSNSTFSRRHKRRSSWGFRERSFTASRKNKKDAQHVPEPLPQVSEASPKKTVAFKESKHRKRLSLSSIKLSRTAPTSPSDTEVPPLPSVSPLVLSPAQSPTAPKPPSRPGTADKLQKLTPQPLGPVRQRSRTKSAEEENLQPLEALDHQRLTKSLGPGQSANRTKRLSSGEHKVLPTDLQSQLSAFDFDSLAQRHFAQRRAGFFSRKTIPVSQLTAWQLPPLENSLKDLDRKLNGEAVKSFKLIQHIMGDRDRSSSKPTRSGSSFDCFQDWITQPIAVLNQPWSSAAVDETRALMAIGIRHGSMRDEIYLQLMKQLTRNPSMHSMFRGWQLFQVVIACFPPSRDLEFSVKQFFEGTRDASPERSEILRLIASHCLSRIGLQASKGPRGRAPGAKEVLVRSMSAFNPNSFGESLEHVQQLQSAAHPEVPIPLVVLLLCNSLLSLDALKTEGIFRISADSESQSELRASVDEGALHVDSAYDVHTVASALKVYFRDLASPLIPSEFYEECLVAASRIDIINRIINKLPLLNRRVLAFLVTFLQKFTNPVAISATKMPTKSLAMVWAPNVLRCESKSMHVAFNNAPHEQTFFQTVLLHFDTSRVNLEGYKPRHPEPVPVGPFRLRSAAMDHLTNLVHPS